MLVVFPPISMADAKIMYGYNFVAPLKRAFLGESQRPVRRLSNQISCFRLETHYSFLAYVQLTFVLHYRIHGSLLTELTVWKAFQSSVFSSEYHERAAMKTQYFAGKVKGKYLKGGFSSFCYPLTTQLLVEEELDGRDDIVRLEDLLILMTL